MIGWITRRPLVALLALVAAIILVVIGVQTGFGTRLDSSASAPPKAAVAAEAKLVPPLVAQAPEQAFPEMASRPLFTPTRRPAPVEPSIGKPAFARGQFVLQGVIVVGDQRTALLKEKASGKIHRVDRGKDLNGITVEAVEPTEVTLVSGGEREKVALVVQRPETPGRGANAAPIPGTDPSGPFTPAAAAAPPVAAAAPASTVTEAIQAQPHVANPASRAAGAARAPGVAGATPPTTQPMTPEELLARRRARRNQPTQ